MAWQSQASLNSDMVVALPPSAKSLEDPGHLSHCILLAKVVTGPAQTQREGK